MTSDAGKVFASAISAMGVILPGLMEWTEMLEESEQAEALFHIGKITDDFRNLMSAVADYAGVEP